MKLSEIKGERTLDVIADLIDPVISIASDENASALFKREKCPDGVEPSAFAMEKVRRSVPALIRDHKDELCVILSTIEGVPTDEYLDGLSIAKLIHDVLELLGDEEFQSFFA